MKGLQVLLLFGLLAVSTWGLSGEGPVWAKYVGAGFMLVVLLLILQGVSNLPTATDLRKAMGAIEQAKQTVNVDDDLDATEARSQRVSRN
jgi:hypothetical protein